MKVLGLCMLGLGIVLPLWASVDVADLTRKQEAKLAQAVERLAQQRRVIAAAELPLLEAIRAAQQETVRLRKEVAQLRVGRDEEALSLQRLQESVQERALTIDYIADTLWAEYWAAYQASLTAGEQARWGESLRKHLLRKQEGRADEEPWLAAGLRLLGQSGERAESLLGGKRYAGAALMPDGVLAEGEFLQLGPIVYFVAGEQAGWLQEVVNEQPRVAWLPEAVSQAIVAWAAGEAESLPLDVSLGDALLAAQHEETVLEHLQKGGVWVYPILFFALLSLLVALLKSVQVLRVRFPDAGVVPDLVALLRRGERAQAEVLAGQQPEPCGAMLVEGVKHSGESIELVEEVMYEALLRVQPRYERFLQVIAVTAAVAPLLGLLGTVTGIIKTFKTMNVVGTGDSQALIGGISEALITTELGLVLAIPALIMHAILSRRVAGVLAHVEQLGVSLVNGLSRKK